MSDSKGAAIDEVLEKYWFIATEGTLATRKRTALPEAKQAILAILAQEVKRVIGEDEPNNYHGASYRNQLRAEQRERLG